MFGYRLQLIKKKELRDIEVFEKTVISLHLACTNLMEYLAKGEFRLDETFCHNLTEMIESIKNLIDIYIDNRYSMPSLILKMAENIDKVSASSSEILVLMTKLYEMNITQIPPTFMIRFDSLIKSIINHTRVIRLNVNYDLMRINTGVDIYEDYKKRKKRSKIKDEQVLLNVKFLATSKGDVLFKEKEEFKSESTK